jgi:hypothetical protein
MGFQTDREVNDVEGGATHVQTGEDAEDTDLSRTARGKRNHHAWRAVDTCLTG